ncbi:methyltransferase [Microvirga tunisiensis]|uniref:Methyltransferase n=1 Tax=Pannonibacter tanglangensis TaxID=2750084 RepID=A0A7X5J7L7_9HYPH|nr:class I SAM-dependent methyltransferase [Pannonibacter sp. XCT-53]NBN77627.1 methyltransferase [Pannonibacter sp. XCT-53]
MSLSGNADWTAGYVADINYTHGYYTELNPLRARLALLNAGLAAPEIATACELGFGQGVSVAVHAAASEAHWCGTDFNPAQAGHAQSLCRAAEVGAHLTDQAFAEFCSRSDLPDFDYIGLHGIWTWISDENRAVIVDFIRRKLKVGGIVYVSYNTLPGWAAGAPLRHLMTEVGASMTSPAGGSTARVEGALGLVDKVLATNPAYVRTNPGVKERFERLKTQNRAYLAHEYFNRDWQPMHVADMARWLAPAKVSFAASCHLLDAIQAINLTAEQQALLGELPDPMLRETLRDYCVNQQFRRDLWVKGPRRLSALDQSDALRALRIALVVPRGEVKMTVQGALGEANLAAAIYGPILDHLADHRARSLAEIEAHVRDRGITFGQVMQAALILTGANVTAVAQEPGAIAKVKKRTDRLNAHLMLKARGSGEIGYLASPVTGGALTVPRFQQLFALAVRAGRKTPADWADFTLEILSAQGQKLVTDGRTLETVEENRAELRRQADAFAAGPLALLRGLEVI